MVASVCHTGLCKATESSLEFRFGVFFEFRKEGSIGSPFCGVYIDVGVGPRNVPVMFVFEESSWFEISQTGCCPIVTNRRCVCGCTAMVREPRGGGRRADVPTAGSARYWKHLFVVIIGRT